MKKIKAASLFSGAGIGEYYLKDIGIDVVISNEIIQIRNEIHKYLYPECESIPGDITCENIQSKIVSLAKKNNVDLLIITPPCQGVSTVGSNKKDPDIYRDPRNFLIISGLAVFEKLLPNYVLIENVPRFERMLFPYENELLPLKEYLIRKYSSQYYVSCDILNAADYGVPQTRYRVVYRMWKKDKKWQLPEKERQITLREAIGNLPSLESGETSNIANHCARKHPENQIECMQHTPSGKSAFFNSEFYPKTKDGKKISGYKNCYKRMSWDMPAPTVTMRNECISSQENVHPGRELSNGLWSDARVLTLRELLIVSSLPPDLVPPDFIGDAAFRQIIGEGIPPLMTKKILQGITGKECSK